MPRIIAMHYGDPRDRTGTTADATGGNGVPADPAGSVKVPVPDHDEADAALLNGAGECPQCQ